MTDTMSVALFKYTIVSAVTALYGQVGRVSFEPDVLLFDPKTAVGVLAFPDPAALRPLWAALTLMGRCVPALKACFEADVVPNPTPRAL